MWINIVGILIMGAAAIFPQWFTVGMVGVVAIVIASQIGVE